MKWVNLGRFQRLPIADLDHLHAMEVQKYGLNSVFTDRRELDLRR